MNYVHCRRCDRDFVWAVTGKGKRMPVDPEPRPDGNLAIYRDHAGNMRCRVITAENPLEAYERPGMPHFATCAPPKPTPTVREDGTVDLATARRNRNARDRQVSR